MIWVAFIGMTALAAAAALWPLLRPVGAEATAAAASASETQFYKAQLDEIARDVDRGALPESEAAAARAEAGRRLIAASAAPKSAGRPTRSVAGRAAAIAAVAVGLPALVFSLYLQIGAPSMPDAPLAGRDLEKAAPNDVDAAVAKVEAHLRANPEDGRGWAVVAPVYMRLERYDEAIHAYSEALRTLGEKPTLRAALGEAMVAQASGVVTDSARDVFKKALADDPAQPMASFYLALASEQEGHKDEAIAAYRDLLAKAPPDAPWAATVRDRIDGLTGAAPALPAPAGASPDGQDAMIRGMVERLATRLAAQGGGVEEWSRLIRAYSVLHQTDKAKTALADARKALAADAPALASLDGLAKTLALGEQP